MELISSARVSDLGANRFTISPFSASKAAISASISF